MPAGQTTGHTPFEVYSTKTGNSGVDFMDAAAAAMVGGQAQAGEFWEPYGSQVLKSLNGSSVASNCKEPFWTKTALLSDGMFMSDEFVNKHRDLAVAAMKAYFDAVAFWRKNPEEAEDIMARGLKFDKADVTRIVGPGGDRSQSLLWIYDYNKSAGILRRRANISAVRPSQWSNLHGHASDQRLVAQVWTHDQIHPAGAIRRLQPAPRAI